MSGDLYKSSQDFFSLVKSPLSVQYILGFFRARESRTANWLGHMQWELVRVLEIYLGVCRVDEQVTLSRASIAAILHD
jgi:hypothetical protein